MTSTLLLRSGFAVFLSALAFGCGDSSPDEGSDPEGAGGTASGDGDGDGSGGKGGDGDGTGGITGDGDGDLQGACGDRVGTPTLDGLLEAAEDITASATSAAADFEAAIANIQAELGLDAAGSLGARVDAIVSALEAEVGSNTNGLWVYAPLTECTSSISQAQEAQLSCERFFCEGGEEVSAEDLGVWCEGACLGVCDGSCSASSTAFCIDAVEAAACAGICDGTCQLDAAEACDGICEGTCSGTCTETDGEGACMGACDGECQGTCTLREPGACEGACAETCLTEAASGGCDGDVTCDFECEGACLGSCAGAVEPASGLLDCESSADCQAQAAALSLAHVSCLATSLRHAFEYVGPEEGEAEFSAKVAAVVAELQAAEDSFHLLSALIAGEVNGRVVYETPPVQGIVQMLSAVVQAGVSGELLSAVSEDQVPCVIPAFLQAIEGLADLTAESVVVLEAQASLVASGRNGFE